MKRTGTATLVPLIAVLSLGLALPAQALENVDPSGASATFEQLECQDFDGAIRVTLSVSAENTAPVEFLLMENRSSYTPDPEVSDLILVAPGETREIVLDGLPDGTRYVEVIVGEVSILPEQQYSVECDLIPTQPYSNPKVAIYDVCESRATVWASNEPIRGVINLLQPVEFIVTVIDPAGATSELDRFTLPEEGSADPYAREPEYEFPPESGSYEIEVTADGKLVAQTPIDTGCVVVPHLSPQDDGAVDVGNDGGVLPATGMGVGLSVMLALGLGLLAAGGAALRRTKLR